MAVAVPQKVYADGSGVTLFVIYKLYGVTAADTVQTSTEFKKLLDARWLPTTGSGVGVAVAATISSQTTATIPAGPAVDDGYLICYGAGVMT